MLRKRLKQHTAAAGGSNLIKTMPHVFQLHWQLQVERDAADVVQLEATFEPSIAYCVWYNFRQLIVHVCDEEALVVMWDCALRAFCQLQFTNAQLSAMLAASPQASAAKSLHSELLLMLQHNLSLNASALDRSRSRNGAHQSVSAPQETDLN